MTEFFFSGCPLFTQQSEVEGPNSRFIKDDTIFIKVIVDIQNIRHPWDWLLHLKMGFSWEWGERLEASHSCCRPKSFIEGPQNFHHHAFGWRGWVWCTIVVLWPQMYGWYLKWRFEYFSVIVESVFSWKLFFYFYELFFLTDLFLKKCDLF